MVAMRFFALKLVVFFCIAAAYSWRIHRRELLRSGVKLASSNVQFETVRELRQDLPNKLLYLPGIDGRGEYSESALGTLSENFNCWRMIVHPNDRSTFLQMAQLVQNQILEMNGGKSIVLIGESFGGLLAAYVAARYPKLVFSLVLVNPATSFDKTWWRGTAAFIAKSGPLFPTIGLTTLVTTAMDKRQFVEIGKRILSDVGSSLGESQIQGIMKELNPILDMPNLLPKETLTWRVTKWLDIGSFVVKDIIGDIKAPTLILIGEEDKMLPSKAEGMKLKRQLKSIYSVLKTYPDRGHALLDNTFPLKEVITDFDTRVRKRLSEDLTMNLPSREDLNLLKDRAGPLIQGFSPVFFSTNYDGKLFSGLSAIPTGKEGRPVLFVGNHQLLGLDLALLINEFIDQKEVLIRGLAHPAIFDESFGNELGQLYERFGAVKVSPKSFYKLLKQNETILLFPGGASEALHRKGENYQLFWPEKTDFVGMAALTEAIIVPFAAIGMADSTKIIADRDDILESRFGNTAREFAERIPQARMDGNESMIFPVVVPTLPSRNYFLFMKPFDTKSINSRNKTECRQAYEEIRSQVKVGITSLLKYRERDNYSNYVPRVLMEKVTQRQAPYPNVTILDNILNDE